MPVVSERGPCVFFSFLFYFNSPTLTFWKWWKLIVILYVKLAEQSEMRHEVQEMWLGWKVEMGKKKCREQQCSLEWGLRMDGLSMKESRKTVVPDLWWTEQTDEKKLQTLRNKCIYSQTRGMHTSSAEYTTFITLNWLLERVGARPLASLSLENWGRRKTKYKQAAQRNDELTCPRERNRVNKVQWRLSTEGPNHF